MEESTLRVSQAFTYSFTNTFRGKPPQRHIMFTVKTANKQTHQWRYSKSQEAVTGGNTTWKGFEGGRNEKRLLIS